MASRMDDDWYRSQATYDYAEDGVLEIDGEAKVSRTDEDNDDKSARGGAYVQAWVWVDDPEEDE